PRRVAQHVANPDLLLPEVGPVKRDGSLELELATLEQEQDANGDEALRAGEDQLEGVAIPARPRDAVAHTAPQIDDELSAANRGERGSQLVPAREVPLELGPDAFEPARYGPRDVIRHMRRS